MKPTVPQVLPLVNCFMRLPGNGVGGVLHIVLSDGNVADSHVEFCRNQAVQEVDQCGYFLATVLLNMSKTQRSKLSANLSYHHYGDSLADEAEFWELAQVIPNGAVQLIPIPPMEKL